MLFVNDEEQVRTNPKQPVLGLGEPVHFAALIRDVDEEEEGESEGFAEYNYDAEICAIEDEDDAETMFDRLSGELHAVEDELLEEGNEGFVALYRVGDKFLLVAGDNGGSDTVAALLSDRADLDDIDHHNVIHCTADKVHALGF